jgi:uncharacterized protein (TIGR02145 family)
MIYITTYPLTQRINPMRKLLLTTAAVAAAVIGTLWLSGCLTKPIHAPAPEASGIADTLTDNGGGKIYAPETIGAYGSFTDDRDGKTYKMMKMPDGKTWLAENLNYKTGESWCYDDDDSNCAKYGRMYDWETALTVCPAGWRLSTYRDWCDLEQSVGGDKKTNEDGTVYWGGAGKKLKAKSGWNDFCGNDGEKSCKSGNGTDNFGFSALPGGAADYDGSYFGNIGVSGGWWTAAALKDENAYVCGLHSGSDNLLSDRVNRKNVFPARCVQAEGAHAVTVSRDGADAKNGGSYAFGDTVAITAGTAPAGKRFKKWTSSSNNAVFADANNATTTFIMPANDVTVTASFDTVVIAVKSGTAYDSRNDQTYKTVIVDGKLWMAENLNYETPEGSWCYNGNAGNCAKYGRLYKWGAAEKACPAGWRLPARQEWYGLIRTAGGRSDISDDAFFLTERDWHGAAKPLKAERGWDANNGTDDYGFSALPGGYFNSDGFFADIGRFAAWWTASGPAFEHSAYGLNIRSRNDFIHEELYFNEFGFSVRCIRDTGGVINEKLEWEQGKEMGQRDAKRKKLLALKRMEEERRIEDLSTYFTDSRDGRKYRAVKIGGLRWMAENLHYEPKHGGSWCQNNDAFYCGKYGRLYDWNTANTICPSGWRLPSRKDWDNLAKAAGGRKEKGPYEKGTVEWEGVSGKLRSKSGWDPRFSVDWTDEYGFSALPNGKRNSNGTFIHIGLDGQSEWWTATGSGGDAFARSVGYYSDSMRESKIDKKNGLPIRCVADSP